MSERERQNGNAFTKSQLKHFRKSTIAFSCCPFTQFYRTCSWTENDITTFRNRYIVLLKLIPQNSLSIFLICTHLHALKIENQTRIDNNPPQCANNVISISTDRYYGLAFCYFFFFIISYLEQWCSEADMSNYVYFNISSEFWMFRFNVSFDSIRNRYASIG